jgi:threonine/homoserine/homoserine lactone efflux protein
MSFAGHGSDSELLGIFQVSVLHNIVHLLFGVVGIALARSEDTARQFLTVGGAVYLVLFVYGAIFHGDSGGNFVPVNWADNILHLGLGIGMIALGTLGASKPRTVHA